MIEFCFKVLDKCLGGLFSRCREKKKVSQAFNALKNKILFLSVVSNMPIELKNLRDFILENNLVDDPKIKIFFEKWLAHFLVERGESVSNFYQGYDIDHMRSDLKILSVSSCLCFKK